MQKELSYQTPDGYTVFTSHYLKNKGTCCKSACLHCPYGFTLKKHGLTFKEVKEEDSTLIEAMLEESGNAGFDWKPFFPDNIRIILLKDRECGLFLKNHIQIKHLFLKNHFQNQGLSKEMVEAYFF